MPNDSLTLVLNGEVSLANYIQALGGLQELIKALQAEVDPAAQVDWIVDELEKGSAVTTFRGRGASPGVIHKVVHGFEGVGRALQKGTRPKHSPKVNQAIDRIISVMGESVPSIRFITDAVDADIYPPADSGKNSTASKALPSAHGCIRGRVQTISNRHGLRFTLYDAIDDRPILCFLAPGNESVMKNAWGKLALVEGIVRRDALSGKPTTIREIRKVVPLKETGSYRDAIGVAPRREGDILSPEDAIRRLRDAG